MLRLLELAGRLLRWTLWLTLVRLLTTAFGWEFGVSRQYLRLLEWLLESGERTVAKVDSEHRMHLDELLIGRNEAQVGRLELESDSQQNGLAKPLVRPASLELDGRDWKGQAAGQDEPIRRNGSLEEPARVRKVSILRGHSECTIGPGQNGFELGPGRASGQELRRRRVSTPDGPPVFLLDDDDDDDDDDQCDENCVENANEGATNGMREINGELRGDGLVPMRRAQKHDFHLADAGRFVVRGISAICDDDVTKRFTPEQLKTWNLLTRTNAKNYQFLSRSLGFYWFCGLLIRYAALMPLRIMFTVAGTLWLISTMSLIGLLVPRAWRNTPFRLMSLMSFRMLSCGITSRLRFHNCQYRAKGGQICVANHTSPLDVVLLACDNCYALVGQRHGGLLGLLETALSRATNHVWFDRDEIRDRQLVTQRLREHVSLKSNLPVLIFPEGTCINNSAVMMFRKGSFETNAPICPVAIKYDPRFGDPFWNSSKQSYVEYLLMMMSSWAIKCDVWYLPPMQRLEHETSAEFANRVKAEIAKQAGLKDLAWDGQLKRSSVKPTWLFQQQEDYVKRLKLD